jgi:hypothetical protein
MQTDRGTDLLRAGTTRPGTVRGRGPQGQQGRQVRLLHRYSPLYAVSDGSATAEVTLIHRRIQTAELLPVRGDSVQIIGQGFRKVLGGKHEYSFLKILALSISAISPEEELAINL